MRDIQNNIQPNQTIKPSSYTASQNGTAVDLQGFSAATALFYLWAGDFTDTDEVYTPKLQSSDDASVWTDVPVAEIEGNLSAVNAFAQEGMQSVGYKGSRRYLRGVLSIAGTSPSILSSATIILGKPHHAPAA